MEHISHLIYISFESEWLRKTGNIVRRRQDTSGHHTPTAEMPYLALSAPSLLGIQLEYPTYNSISIPSWRCRTSSNIVANTAALSRTAPPASRRRISYGIFVII